MYDATVLIPTYRRPFLLRRAIESAVAQAGVRLAIRVFDNCSGDETGEIVDALRRRHPSIEYRCHSENIGATANFDLAIRSVDTEFFSILSDDDYLLPGFFKNAIEGLRAVPEAGFWAGLTLNVDEQGVIWDAKVARWSRFGLYRPPEGVRAMTGGMAPVWTSIVFRRSVLESHGMPDLSMLGPSDLDFILRLAAHQPYIIEDHPSAVFTLNQTSYSATQPLSAFWPGWLQLIENARAWGTLSSPDRQEIVGLLLADYRKMLFRRGLNALAAGRLEFAREAAGLLAREAGQQLRASVLRTSALACERLPAAQWATTAAYRKVERLLVRSRQGLQDRYGSLLRPGRS